MRANLQPILIALTIIALFCGCASAPGPATLSQMAVAKSNEEAQRLYHVAPFKLRDGNFVTEGNHRVWDALTSSGGFDVVSKVIFDRSGSVVSIEVRMQSSLMVL